MVPELNQTISGTTSKPTQIPTLSKKDENATGDIKNMLYYEQQTTTPTVFDVGKYKTLEVDDKPTLGTSAYDVLEETIGKIVSIEDDKITALIKINEENRVFVLPSWMIKVHNLNQGDIFKLEAIEYTSSRGKIWPRITKKTQPQQQPKEFPPVDLEEFKKYQV